MQEEGLDICVPDIRFILLIKSVDIPERGKSLRRAIVKVFGELKS